MELETQCPICLLNYTTTGTHRMTSLKCGHCFGHKCIERWISMHKRPCCPTCSSPCRASHLRIVYIVKKTVFNQMDEELVEKYLQEAEKRQKLEAEVAGLKAQIEILHLSARSKDTPEKKGGLRIHLDFLRFTKIHFFPNGSLVEFDPINRLAIITCLKNGVHGLYKYSLHDGSAGDFIKFRERISDLKISPFQDGLCLVASGNEVSLMNLYNNRLVFNKEFDHRLTAVGFDIYFRDILYAGDACGNVHSINTLVGQCVSVKVSSHGVHSLCASNGVLYAATVFDAFQLDVKSGAATEASVLPFEFDGVCVNLSGEENHALFTFRNRDLVISQILLGETEMQFFPALKQKSRHSDRVFGGYVYVTDDVQNIVNVLSPGSLHTVHSYRFKEAVVNLAVSADLFVVLTQRGVYWFGNGARDG